MKNKLSTLDRTQTFFGQPVLQAINAFGVYEILLQEVQPKVIVEIGTGHGTLSLYFALWSYLNEARFFTIDNLCKGNPDWIPKNEVANLLKSLSANVIIGDVFETNLEDFLKIGRSLLFCDGGDKRKELNEFAPLTKPGSLIIVHDWPKSCDEKDRPNCLSYHPYHDASLELGTKAAIFVRD